MDRGKNLALCCAFSYTQKACGVGRLMLITALVVYAIKSKWVKQA